MIRAGVGVAAGDGLENEPRGPGHGHRRASEGSTRGVVFRFTFQTGHAEGDERQVKGGQGRRPGYARKQMDDSAATLKKYIFLLVPERK